MSLPILCGYDRAGVACTDLAVVEIEAPGRRTLACPFHVTALERWAAAGGHTVVTRSIRQAAGAVPGSGQGTLFDLGREALDDRG